MSDHGSRNMRMAERIGATAVRYPFSFVIAGDSGAWPDPTADAIFAQLVRQTCALRPAPVFFANLGDFAGPGTRERHERYLRLVSPLEIPDVCLVGNHDLEDPRGADAWSAVHGPRNFHFAYANTRFVAVDGASGQAGERGDTTPPGARRKAIYARGDAARRRILDVALEAFASAELRLSGDRLSGRTRTPRRPRPDQFRRGHGATGSPGPRSWL